MASNTDEVHARLFGAIVGVRGSTIRDATTLAGGNFSCVHRVEHEDGDAFFVKHAPISQARRVEGLRRAVSATNAVRAAGVNVPETVWTDLDGELCGESIVVERWLDASTTLPGGQEPIEALAATLAMVHRVTAPPTLPVIESTPSPELTLWTQPHPRAASLSADLGEPPVTDPVLVHGDFWSGNTLWRDGEVVAVVDWTHSGVGSAAMDVSKAMLDLVLLRGPDASQHFLAAYVGFAGADVAGLGWWQRRMALEGMPDPGRWWLPTYRALGYDVTPDAVRSRFEAHLDTLAVSRP